MNLKKVCFVSFTFNRGGAGIAASRIENLTKITTRPSERISVEQYNERLGLQNKCKALKHYTFWILSHILCKLFSKNKYTKNSLNIFGNDLIHKRIIQEELLHIHWINNEAIAIKYFNCFNNKAVITLHDEWFYCGTEHHCIENGILSEKYEIGYKNEKLSLNRIIWKIKLKYYKNLKGVIFTVPSNWMKIRAIKSPLLKNHEIRVVPNPIDTEIFSKKINHTLKYKLGIQSDDFVLLYCGGKNNNFIKGRDLLKNSLRLIKLQKKTKIKVLIVGQSKKTWDKNGIQFIQIPFIKEQSILSNIYSISNITIVPSRIESFCQVAAESLSCETPVVCFDCTGVKDIVIHNYNGYLAKPYCVRSLADGINYFYNIDIRDYKRYATNARKHILNFFANEIIASKFEDIYKKIDQTNKLNK